VILLEQPNGEDFSTRRNPIAGRAYVARPAQGAVASLHLGLAVRASSEDRVTIPAPAAQQRLHPVRGRVFQIADPTGRKAAKREAAMNS
jgi:hypothetical protein